MSLAGSTPAPSAAARAGGSGRAPDGVRGVTAAREPVELEATGSTPAGHPDRESRAGDDDARRAGDTFRGVLLGEQRASKTRGQGSNPCAPAPAGVAEWRGPCLVSRFMPVRVRPSASTAPSACDGRHATFRRSKTRFDSWRGHSAVSPRVWRTHGGLRSRKAGFDSRVGGFSVGLIRSLSSGCDGRAHDPAKVEDQVRFLART
jgi:hypothetical protein